MLYPSDPSCSSSRVSKHKSDKRISEQDPVLLSFGDPHTPNFSIRDYVFASRGKNSGKSWPFPSWLLEFFLKNGVKDLLPPFETPSSVRQYIHRSSEAETEEIRINSPLVGEKVSSLPSDENFLICLDKNEGQCSSEDKAGNLINDCEIGSTSTVHRDIVELSPNFGEPVVKKRRLVLPGIISEANRTEEIASTSIAPDSMASKVCPVCKTFSSTSNTTLNAHMDQCLSMASDTTLTVDEIPKLKVKPKKKRLMEDIYATASHCSLEDLDRRNGTCWATSLNYVSAPIEEGNSEAKRPDFTQVDARDERTEGAVYVDSNGIKLRILSKFNDASPQVVSREAQFRPRKNIKHVRDGKRNFLGEKHAKKLKLKMESKKLRSLKLFKDEAAPEDTRHERAHQEDSPVRLSSELNQAQASHENTSTLQRWTSCKRSDLLEKISKKDFISSLDRSEPVTKASNMDTRKSASGTYSSARRHIKLKKKENFEKSFQESLSEDTSTNTFYKLSSEAMMLPSPNSRNDEFCMGRKHKFHDPPLKTIRISSLTGSNSGSIKTCMHRSVLRSTKRKRDFSLNSNTENQRFADHITSDQCLHTGNSLFQNAKQSCSKRLFINSKISLDEVDDDNSITARFLSDKSLNREGTSPLLPSDDKLSPVMPIEESGMMMIEQLSRDKQDEPLIRDNLESRGVESETGAVSTESSACLTSHGELEPDNQRENCSIASSLIFPNQDSNLAVIRELPGYSTSNSIIFNSKSSKRELGRFTEHNQQFHMDSTMNKPQQQSDCHHCCCSYQSMMAGTMPSNPRIFPNLFIKPSISSAFGGAFSCLQTEMTTAPSLESKSCSMAARACNNVVCSTSPSCGTTSQSSSNSILRLMGKDLMISNNESSNLPKFDSSAKDKNFNVPYHENFPFTVRNPVPTMSNMQARSHLPYVQQSNINNKACLKDDIVSIDGSLDDDMMMRGTSFPVQASHTMFQRFSPYFLPHNQLFPGENGYVTNEGSSLEVPAPPLPRPFMFRSPSNAHLKAPFYYPQSLR